MKPLFLFSSCCLSSPFSLTFFSSLRLTDREMPNDLKKTRRLFDESTPVLRKSCLFLSECSALFGGYGRGRKKNEALSAQTCDECEEKASENADTHFIAWR
jgi:hypothetical protein